MNITRFDIKGRAHCYKINSLIRRGFKPKNIRCINKSLSFDEVSSNEASIVAFCDEMCYDYEIVKRVGLRHSLDSLVNNSGLFIGLIVSIIILVICSMFVLEIDILGVERTDINNINQAIEASNVKRFGLIYKIDKKILEQNVLNIDGISSVSIETRGVKVYIHIKEELPESNINDYLTPTPIVSEYNTIVTRVIVLTGTALVKKGDTVLKGQTLIAPYISDGKVEEGETETRMPIKATGIVYGRVWYSESININKEEIILRRTGRYIDIATPTYIISGKAKKEIIYELYEAEENKIIYNAFFPLIVTYTRYYELEEVTIIRDDSTNYNDIISSAYIRLRNQIPIEANVVRLFSNIKEVDNMTIIDVYLETEQKINDGG